MRGGWKVGLLLCGASFHLMREPIDGGPPELVEGSAIPNGYVWGGLNFSPDGKWIPEIAAISDPATHSPKTKSLSST